MAHRVGSCGRLLTHTTAGSDELRANVALVNSLWACAVHEAGYRRLRADEKRMSHAKQKRRHADEAQVIARMVERIGS